MRLREEETYESPVFDRDGKAARPRSSRIRFTHHDVEKFRRDESFTDSKKISRALEKGRSYVLSRRAKNTQRRNSFQKKARRERPGHRRPKKIALHRELVAFSPALVLLERFDIVFRSNHER